MSTTPRAGWDGADAPCRADLLDSIKIEVEGKRHPLAEFATVSVKDGKDLVVTVYEESVRLVSLLVLRLTSSRSQSLKAVSHAIYASPLSLAPQHISATTLRVPIPRPDWDKRQALVKQASELCEHARVAVRAARGKGQKEIKADVDGKAIGKDEGRSEVKKVRSTGVDCLHGEADQSLSCSWIPRRRSVQMRWIRSLRRRRKCEFGRSCVALVLQC